MEFPNHNDFNESGRLDEPMETNTTADLQEHIQKETQQFKTQLQNEESTIQSMKEHIQKITQQFQMELQNKESTIQSMKEHTQKETQQFQIQLPNEESTIQSMKEHIQKITQQFQMELQNKETTIQTMKEHIQKEIQQFQMQLQNKESTIQSMQEHIQKEETQQLQMELQNEESTIQSMQEHIQKETQLFNMELQNKESTIQSRQEYIQKETQQFQMQLQNKESTIQSMKEHIQKEETQQLQMELQNEESTIQSMKENIQKETQLFNMELQNKESTMLSRQEYIQKETQQFQMQLQNKESTIQSIQEHIQKESQPFKRNLQNEESIFQSLDDNIRRLKTENEHLQTQLKQFQKNIKEKERNNLDLAEKDIAIQQQMEKVKEEHDIKCKTLNQRVQQLNNDNKRLSEETQKLRQYCQQYEDQMKKLNLHLTNVETEKKDLLLRQEYIQRETQRFEKELQNKESTIQSLDDNIRRLKTENEHLQTQLKQSQKNIKEKERNNLDLAEKDIAIQQQMEKLKEEHDIKCKTLNQRVQQLNNDNKRLSEETQKLRQYCQQYEDQMKKLNLHLTNVETEKKDLLLRMSKVASANLVFNNPNIADLSDANRPTKLAEKFSELYDNEWTDAFEAIPSENEKQKTLMLLTLLESVNELCHKLANHHKENIETSFMSIDVEYPFSSTQDSKIQQLDALMCTKTQNESAEIAADVTRNDKNTQDGFERCDNNSSNDAETEKRFSANNELSDKTNFNSGKQVTITGEKAEPKRQVNCTDVELTYPSENNTHNIINPAEHDVHHNSQEQSISDVNHNSTLPVMNNKCISKTTIDNTDINSNNANSVVGNVHVSQKPVLHGGLSNNDPNVVTKHIKDNTALTTAMGNGDTHIHDTKDLSKCNGDDIDSIGNIKTTGHTCAEKGTLDEANACSVYKKLHITDTDTKDQKIQQNIQEQSNPDVNYEKTLDSKSQAVTNMDKNIIKHSTSMNQKNDGQKAGDNAIIIPNLDKTNKCERDDTILSQEQLTDCNTISKEEDKSCGTLDKAVQVELQGRNNVATWTSRPYHIKTDTKFVEFSKEQKKTVQDMSKIAEFHFTSDTVDLITKLVSSSSRICQDEHVRKYIQDCAKICWSMQLHHPPVHIDFVKETNQPFNNIVYKPYTKTGQRLDYIVWPSLYLHKDGPMLSKGVAQGV